MRNVHILVLLLALLLPTACRSKLSPDDVYTFPEHPISVRAPHECIVDMWVGDTPNSVDFNTGRYYWEMSGEYYVIVMDIPDEVVDTESFIAVIRPWFRDVFRPRESNLFKLSLALKDEHEMEVNGRPAYRYVLEDPGKGIVVATATLHRQRMTIAALAYSLEDHTEAEIPWACYEAFVASVTETP